MLILRRGGFLESVVAFASSALRKDGDLDRAAALIARCCLLAVLLATPFARAEIPAANDSGADRPQLAAQSQRRDQSHGGTAADYQFAAEMPRRIQGLVARDEVDIHWIDGSRLWYRVNLGGGADRFRYVFVDGPSGTRSELLDHRSLAQTLSRELVGLPNGPDGDLTGEAARSGITDDRLPIERVAVELLNAPGDRTSERIVRVLAAGGRAFRSTLSATGWSEWEEVLGDELRGFEMPLRPDLVRSRSAGPSIRLQFSNRRARLVRLVWVDVDGQKHDYGTISPGETRSQQTFGGHAWALFDQDGELLGSLLAPNASAIVPIEKDLGQRSPSPPLTSAPAAPTVASPTATLKRSDAAGLVEQVPPRSSSEAPAAWLAKGNGEDGSTPHAARVASANAPRPRGSPALAVGSTIAASASRDRSESTSRVDCRIRAFNVELVDESGQLLWSTTDGTADRSYGEPLEWSPDGRKLVVTRRTPADRHIVNLIESSPRDQTEPRLHSFDYLKPGDRIEQTWPVLIDVEKLAFVEATRSAEGTTLYTNPWSISHLRWERDSRGYSFVYNQRGHQVLRVIRVDALSGRATAVINEERPTFIDYAGKFLYEPLPETQEVLWMSERDGWNHLYLIDGRSGEVKSQITRGSWVVRGVDFLDLDRRELTIRLSGIHPHEDPYHVHVARVRMDGSGFVMLTEGDGTHDLTWSPDRSFYVDRWSRVDLPPVTELRRAADGSLVLELERADWSDLIATGWQPPERFVAKGRDGTTDIWGVLWRPSTNAVSISPSSSPPEAAAGRSFTSPLPVIENIYAGPQSAFVPKSFSPWHGQRALAELGFIVVQIDGMGTSHRSKAFHDVCWKNLKDAGFPDRKIWLRAAAVAHPEMDLSRVGIYGGSAGGQSAVRALLDHHDLYKVAVADCGCHDNRMDKIWWNELWMGWPVDESYVASSNVVDAAKLEGKLLLTVGELDRNVDPASTMQVVDALVKAEKDFELLVLPGMGHGAGESAYGQRRRADFFVRHLMGVEPRGSSADVPGQERTGASGNAD
jgi:dipeptidyl-peptidase-4